MYTGNARAQKSGEIRGFYLLQGQKGLHSTLITMGNRSVASTHTPHWVSYVDSSPIICECVYLYAIILDSNAVCLHAILISTCTLTVLCAKHFKAPSTTASHFFLQVITLYVQNYMY